STDTEVEIIKSRFMAEMIAQKIDFTHRYYTTRHYKEVELYEQSPFEVGMNRGFGISFELMPVDDKHYRLIVKKAKDANGNVIVDEAGEPWHFDEVLEYGQEIKNKHFHLNVRKTKVAKEKTYRFEVTDPKEAGLIIQERVSVSKAAKKANILTLSIEDNVPLRAQQAVNALANAYIAQSVEKKNKEATQTLNFVDKQLKNITKNLRGSAVKLEEFKRSSNTVNLSSKAENIIKIMSMTESKLSEVNIQDQILHTLYEKVKSGKGLESLTMTGSQLQAPGMVGLPTMIQDLQNAIIQKKKLREEFTELHREVRKLTISIDQLKSVIISTIENLLNNIQERKNQLVQTLAENQKLLNTLPADERMFGQLQRKFEVNEKIYSYLLEKRSETAIVKASTVSKNRVIDTALLPKHPIKPKRKLIVIVGFILGLLLGITLAFIRNFMDDTIKSEEDITKVTGDIPILAQIPFFKKDSDQIQVFLSPKSAATESYRNLRTNLQFMSTYEKSHVIAVTSTVGGEGKTTNVINIGAIISLAGKRTILLNLDMRKPTLHEKFRLTNTKGMSNILSGNEGIVNCIQQTEYDNLDIISSGPVPPNPGELIQGEAMKTIIDKLREVYDVIIMDTPPIGLVTDARILMHLSDTSIYVMRANVSKKTYLKNVLELSRHKEIRGLSILLNAIKGDRHGYGGYGYYEEEN
ncbi:tyrosine-protein kinase, partial [Sulfurovum sp.]|uniref:GumC family protein n=1 Tax=Sulfurovum sp. TaxID=1969726 RepID=UPI0025E5303C